MNRVCGTDGNVYETSISNGKEYTSSKNEKEEFAIEELKKIKSELLSHTGGSNIFGSLYVDVKDINRVFDRRIAELKGENKMEKEYELGNCPCCQKTDLVIVDKKIICKFCNNWAWLEDARNSSWLKELKGEEQ